MKRPELEWRRAQVSVKFFPVMNATVIVATATMTISIDIGRSAINRCVPYLIGKVYLDVQWLC